MRTQVRPVFFLFMILGAFVVVPFLLTRPVQVTLGAAWRKCPALLWRPFVVVSVLLACLVTAPGSPIFVGLNGPVPVSTVEQYPLVQGQFFLINAALIGMLVCLPVSAMSTWDTYRRRKKEPLE